MRKKDKNKRSLENPNQVNTLVASTKVVGDIISESCLRIDGEVLGNVKSNGKLVLGESGVIKGNISAVEIEINGVVQGQIDAQELLTLHSTAKVYGDVVSAKLVINEGAIFDGNIKAIGKHVAQSTPSSSKIKPETKAIAEEEVVLS